VQLEKNNNNLREVGFPYLPQTLPVKGVGLESDGRVGRLVGIWGAGCACKTRLLPYQCAT